MSSINANENCGLHHLVEAATALTQLVSRVPASRASSVSAGSANGQLHDAHAISDDEESKKDMELKQPSVPANAEGPVSNAGSIPAPRSLGEKTPQSSPEATEKKLAPATSNPPTGNPCPREIFPQRLMRILSDSSITDIITWLPHGRSFVIVQPEVLAEKILPTYFPESCSTQVGSTSASCKYPSFTRKLNRWGFRQVTRGPDAGAFHHKFFRRDDPSQCRQMICQRSRRRKVDENRNVVILPRGILPRTVTASADLGMPSNNNNFHHPTPSTSHGIKGRPLPTVQNYRTKSPPTASVTSTNVSSNIISNTTSPAQQIDSYQGPIGGRAPDNSLSTNQSIHRAPNPAVHTLQQQQLDAHALLQRNLAILKQQQQSQAPVGAPGPASAAPSPPTLPSLYNPHQQAAAASLLAPLLQQAQVAHQPNLAYMLHQHAAAQAAQVQAARSSPTQINMQQPTAQVFPPLSNSGGAPVPAMGTNATTTSPSQTSLVKAPTPPAPATATTDATTINQASTDAAGKNEKSEAEMRIENAKTMLYNAYLKALG